MLVQGWFPEDLVKQSDQKSLGTGANTPLFSKMAEQTFVNCNQTMWLKSPQGSALELLMGFTFTVITSQVCTPEPTQLSDWPWPVMVWTRTVHTGLLCWALGFLDDSAVLRIAENFRRKIYLENAVMYPFFLLACPPWGEHPSLQSPMAMFCLTTRLGLMEANTMDWNLQTVSQNVLSFVQQFMSGIVLVRKKVTSPASLCLSLWQPVLRASQPSLGLCPEPPFHQLKGTILMKHLKYPEMIRG